MANRSNNIVYREEILNKAVNIVSKFYNMGRQDSENGYYYKPHIQEEFEIVYILEGTIGFCINGQKFSVHSGDVYFVQPGQQHEEFSDSDFVSFYYIKCSFQQNNGNIAYLVDEYEKQIIPQCHNEIKDIIEKMFGEVYSKRLGYWQVTEALLVELLCNLIRVIRPQESEGNRYNYGHSEKISSYGNYIINEAIEVINANENKMLTVEQLATSVSISESYLHTLFKKHLRTSPIKFMTALKIDQAKRMMLQTDMTITSIANCYGFSSVSSFVKVFKRLCGVTPQEYRKQFKK